MPRTRVRSRRAGALLAGCGVVLGLAWPGLAPEAPAPAAARSYVVRPGDTIWSIAEGIAGEGADPRPLVDAIAQRNRLVPGELAPGMTLNVPSTSD